MNLNIVLQYAAGAMMLLIWTGLAYIGKVPPDPLISLLQLGLGGLITHMLSQGGTVVPAGASASTPPAVVISEKGWFSLPFISFLIFVGLVTLGLLGGCASLTDAGHTGYTLEPIVGADGKTTGGCKFSATDGKEYSGRSIAATSTSSGCQVMVQEGASTAFQGQAIAGKALSVLPSFAPILLPQGPASLAMPAATPASGAK